MCILVCLHKPPLSFSNRRPDSAPILTRENDVGINEAETHAALTRLDPLWNELFPAEQARIVALLVERVDIGTDGLNVRLRTDGLAALAREMTKVIEAAA